jgi:type II secretory pathway pseudopilin PulG
MSNVLIGIIGVILFIGLALAGALFLGPRFQESTNNSKASAVVQQMQQLSSAVNMYQVNEGKPVLADDYNGGTSTVVSGGYIKTMMRNPVNNQAYYLVDDGWSGAAVPAKFVYTILGNDSVALSVCRAIEKQSGAADGEFSTSAANGVGTSYATQNRRPGCFRRNATEIGAYIPI